MIWNDHHDHYEQSSEDIWNATCWSSRQAMVRAGAKPEEIRGVGFDATCSLCVLCVSSLTRMRVVLDSNKEPVSVSPNKTDARNVILWMDHRAKEQAKFINKSGHEGLQLQSKIHFIALKYVGNCISPEMETPKLLWLKQHHPEGWSRASYFFDLVDFLTFKATGPYYLPTNFLSYCR